MTDDTHGDAPHDPEHDAGFEHEQEPAAVEGETWHGGGEVEDDFSDDPAAVEMTTAADENEIPNEAAEIVETQKKRGMALPVIATVCGIMLLCVLIYWQFSNNLHSDTQPTSPGMQAMFPKSTPEASSTTTTTTTTGVAAKTDLQTTAPIVVEKPKPVIVAAPPAPTSTTVTVIEPPAAPVAPAPAAAPVPVVSAVPPTTVMTIAANPSAPAADTKTAGASDARLSALSAKVEDLQKSLDQATQQLNQISAKLASSQSNQSTLDIEGRLNGIEQKLMQMNHAPAAAPAKVAVQEPSVVVPDMDTEPTVIIKKTVHHKAPVTHKPVHHKTAPVSTAKTHMVLRAASPDEAWIAKNQITTDLQPVHVGDTAPGIGRVTAIREDVNGWVIDGTHGSIR